MLTIAEIGSNYNNLDDILKYIGNTYCDIIKLQHYSAEELYGNDQGTNCQHIPVSWWEVIKEKCKYHDKKLMVSFFKPAWISFFNPFVDYHKVASSEITFLPLLDEVSATGKEVFVSCGGASIPEITRAVDIIGKDKIILMGSRVEYPTNKSYPLDGKRLGDYYGCRWGYSDHSKEIYVIHDLCKELGAYAWEKHVTFDYIQDKPDSHVAISVADFNDSVQGVHSPHVNPHKRIFKNGNWVRPL